MPRPTQKKGQTVRNPLDVTTIVVQQRHRPIIGPRSQLDVVRVSESRLGEAERAGRNVEVVASAVSWLEGGDLPSLLLSTH
jgi:hypothetical protein